MKQNQQGQLVCDWQEFWHHCEVVANLIIESGKDYSQIVAIIRGGFYLADYLSRVLNLPISVIIAKSYANNNLQQSLSLSNLSYTVKPAGKILLVDDLIDTGVTIAQIKQKLIQDFRVEVDTAVIWQKSEAQFRADYCHSITPTGVWIVQPFDQPSTSSKLN